MLCKTYGSCVFFAIAFWDQTSVPGRLWGREPRKSESFCSISCLVSFKKSPWRPSSSLSRSHLARVLATTRLTTLRSRVFASRCLFPAWAGTCCLSDSCGEILLWEYVLVARLGPIGSLRCKWGRNVPSNLPISAWMIRSDLPILMNLVSLSNQNLGPADHSSRVHHFVAFRMFRNGPIQSHSSNFLLDYTFDFYVFALLCVPIRNQWHYSYLIAKQKGHQMLTSNQTNQFLHLDYIKIM